MEKMKDSDLLARLIYRAYIAPDPHAPLEAEALLPFAAALRFYARTVNAEEAAELMEEKRQQMLEHTARDAAGRLCTDSCPVTILPDPPENVSDSDTTAGGRSTAREQPDPSPATLRAKNVRSMRTSRLHRHARARRPAADRGGQRRRADAL